MNLPASAPIATVAGLDPRRTLRWIWLGRVVMSCAILVAAVFVWNQAERADTLIATLTFAVAVLTTVVSVVYGELEHRPISALFFGGQCAIDLGLVTAIVHVTGGWNSQFAALYVLVIASAALLLPFRGGLIVAVGAGLLFAADGYWLRPGGTPIGMAVQQVVFLVVAIGSGLVAQRLRSAGQGQEALAARLITVQLEASDILRSIRAGIITVDAEGRLLYANPSASELLGIDLAALTGAPVLEAVQQVSPQLATVLSRSSTEGVRATRAEGIIRRETGILDIGVTTTVSEATDPDHRHRATAIFQDISDSKRVQAFRVRAERLEAVAELSASLAHEIRNPLASIRSAAEQLAARHAGGDQPEDEDARILNGLMVRESDRLSRLLGDFLDFARARVTTVQPVDVGDLARHAVRLAVSHPDRHPQVAVTIEVEPDLPRVVGDQDLLHRGVFNLVLNAVQAVGDTGHVRVQVLRDRSGISRPIGVASSTAEWIAVRVEDDGPGIPPTLRARLFEPFVTGRAGGSGLGLPVVHRAAESHHGVVVVDDLPRGTAFTLLLPASATLPVADDATAMDTSSESSLT